ncbi:MAG: AMP-dependent synthetase [Betaproteobacteria bacterium SG8_39]|nr:MAG: AMP-dependent synthetase [Betaproteobacteria bacterium SG8_39]
MNTLLTLLTPRAAEQHYRSGAWRADTFYSLLVRHAAERPQAPALRDARLRLSWRALLEWVDAMAESLHRAGVKRGERVAVWLPSRCESVVALLACARNGYVCNPSLHQNYTVAEIVQLLERTRAAALVMQPGYGADAAKADVIGAAQALGHVKAVYAVPGAQGGDGRAQPFAARGAAQASSQPALDDPDKIIYLAFTSGTTGVPKGVMHSDNTLLANGRAMVADWHHDHSTILLSLSPMSHHIGTVAVEQMLAAGFELAVNDPPAGLAPLDWALESGATYIMGVPTHAIDMLAEAKRRGLATLGAVKLFYMAGSPIPREVAQAFLDMGITPQNIYGMTENGSHQYTLPTDDAQTIVETCGRACHGYETRIFDPENPDREVPAGAVGEIGTRGALLMLGYFDNQLTTEGSFNAGGWFLSGDLGTLDDRGCLRIMGRKKDLIIRGGHNIHPARIEDLAHRHPAVQKAAAFGVPDTRLGEKACLAVILREGERVSGEAMLDHLHAVGLSKYDMPEFFLGMDAFPLTASGKILKRELQEWVTGGRITPQPVRWREPAKET